MGDFKIYSFETLDVWKDARKLYYDVYQVTKQFPTEEKFGLVSQMRRCANSVSSNIAESTSRESFKDQARFSEIAYGSLMELLNHSILSFDLNFISAKELSQLRSNSDKIATKLNGLRKSQIERYYRIKRK